MRKMEQDKFHEAADRVWEIAKEAHNDGYFELESVLKQLCDMLHAKGSGFRSRLDSII